MGKRKRIVPRKEELEYPIEDELFRHLGESTGFSLEASSVNTPSNGGNAFVYGLKYKNHLGSGKKPGLDQYDRQRDPVAIHRYWKPFFK